jgi:hypothetical protein
MVIHWMLELCGLDYRSVRKRSSPLRARGVDLVCGDESFRQLLRELANAARTIEGFEATSAIS